MPFESEAQSRACFATGGFGGKVDCEEWASKTDYEKLPKKKKKAPQEKTAADELDPDVSSQITRQGPLGWLLRNTAGHLGVEAAGIPELVGRRAAHTTLSNEEMAQVLSQFKKERPDQLERTVIRRGPEAFQDVYRILTNPRHGMWSKGRSLAGYPGLWLEMNAFRSPAYFPGADVVYMPVKDENVLQHELGHAIDFNRLRKATSMADARRLDRRHHLQPWGIPEVLLAERQANQESGDVLRAAYKDDPATLKKKILDRAAVLLPAFKTYTNAALGENLGFQEDLHSHAERYIRKNEKGKEVPREDWLDPDPVLYDRGVPVHVQAVYDAQKAKRKAEEKAKKDASNAPMNKAAAMSDVDKLLLQAGVIGLPAAGGLAGALWAANAAAHVPGISKAKRDKQFWGRVLRGGVSGAGMAAGAGLGLAAAAGINDPHGKGGLFPLRAAARGAAASLGSLAHAGGLVPFKPTAAIPAAGLVAGGVIPYLATSSLLGLGEEEALQKEASALDINPGILAAVPIAGGVGGALWGIDDESQNRAMDLPKTPYWKKILRGGLAGAGAGAGALGSFAALEPMMSSSQSRYAGARLGLLGILAGGYLGGAVPYWLTTLATGIDDPLPQDREVARYNAYVKDREHPEGLKLEPMELKTIRRRK